MENHWGFRLCGKPGVSEESIGEAIGKGVANLQQLTPSFSHASTMSWPPRTAAVVEWIQAVCNA